MTNKMQEFTKKDLYFSIATGLTTGFIVWRVSGFLNIEELFGVSLFWLNLIVPIFWILGVNLGYFLGQWIKFFNQFGKFVAVGFANAAVDFGVLNLLIYFSDINSGFIYSVFKAGSFLMAVMHSYFWNKFWVFEAGESQGGKTEFGKFFSVALTSIIINVLTASIVVDGVSPLFGISPNGWANVGAVAGSFSALIFSFLGFRWIVFKK